MKIQDPDTEAQDEMRYLWLDWFMQKNYGALAEVLTGEYNLTHERADRNVIRN